MELINTFRAAEILQCNAQTIREMLKRGQIKRVGDFRDFLFNRKQIERVPKVRRGRPSRKDTRTWR